MAVVAGVEEDLVKPATAKIRPPRQMVLAGEGDPGALDPAEGEVPATGKTGTPPKLTLRKEANRQRPRLRAQERTSLLPRRRLTMPMTARSALFVRPPWSTPRCRHAITGPATFAL